MDDCIETLIQYSSDKHGSGAQSAMENMRNLQISATSDEHHEESYFEAAPDDMVHSPPPNLVAPNLTQTSIQDILNQTASGTIPKSQPKATFLRNPFALTPQTTMSSLLKHGSNEFTDVPAARSKLPKLSDAQSPELSDIISHIEQGHKIMVFMRGAAGSGKSHLALYLLSQTMPEANPDDHVCSADSFFMTPNGHYNYDRSRISEAHAFSHTKIRKLAAMGRSPLIVDNTHIKVWEMDEDIGVAIQNGYFVRILEPNTEWRNSAGHLARRNVHGVPKSTIKIMLRNYEPTSVAYILRNAPVSYTNSLPQMRRSPPFTAIRIPLNNPSNTSINTMISPINQAKPQRNPTATLSTSSSDDSANPFMFVLQQVSVTL